VIFIDSDVFLIDLRYRRDEKYEGNSRFLSAIARTRLGVTSIINLMEICGIMSFNLNGQQLYDLFYHLPTRYGIQVFPRVDLNRRLPAFPVSHILQVMTKKSSFGDSLIICASQDFPAVSHFVSWNARHFVNHLAVPCITPAEALALEFIAQS
jgi:hypothetical protein